MVKPTEDQLKCVLRCFKTNLSKNSLWSQIASRLNILSNTRYSISEWQRTLEQFTRRLMARKNLSHYLANKYGESPLSLTKMEQIFLKAATHRVAPCNDNNLFSCCRICLASDSSEMIYIFDNRRNNMKLSFLDKLTVSGCFDVEPELDDNMPQFVCINCSALVESAYQLRMLCLKNEEKLREIAIQEKFMNGLFDSENGNEELEIDYKE